MTIANPNPTPSNTNNYDGDSGGDDQDFLGLSLSTNTKATSPPPPPRNRRLERRFPILIFGPGKTEKIPPPYPWATDHRATVHSLQHLKAKGIDTISGSVQCKRCDKQFEIEYDLRVKSREVAAYIMKHSDEMRQRAPAEWMNPTLPDCKFCEQSNCVKPVGSKKKDINWLFLFLGQMVGCCKLSELKYFCKHTRKHRTGAKDRVLYLTYLEICSQLDPQGTSD